MDALDQFQQPGINHGGLAWASGINLATPFTLGYLANAGNIDLLPDLRIAANPMIMAAAGTHVLHRVFCRQNAGC